jgi:hypothetical protein
LQGSNFLIERPRGGKLPLRHRDEAQGIRETSVVSYLTALPSVDVVRAGHQTITQKWWSAREGFDLYISQFVLDEAAQGDAEAADRRLAALDDISLLAWLTLLSPAWRASMADFKTESALSKSSMACAFTLAAAGWVSRRSRRSGRRVSDGELCPTSLIAGVGKNPLRVLTQRPRNDHRLLRLYARHLAGAVCSVSPGRPALIRRRR